MQYRKFGKHGIEVSTLGFGCMRFPTIDGDTKKIDEEEATKMLRYAIDNGVNYVDTAWPYHGEMSEPFVGRALQDGYREKVFLATKSPVYYVEDPQGYDKYLNEQLEKLQTDYIDFYLLHALDHKSWANCVKNNVFDFIKGAKEDGRIKYIGFSFHDQPQYFKEIVDAYDWDFVQIQLNYMNEEYQAGLEGLHYAASKGLPVVIMEPLLGGRLAESQGDLQKIWDNAPTKRTPVDWALRWLLDKPEVTVILSGMSTMDHVVENVQICSEATANSMTQEERDVIEQAKQFYLDRTQVDCTACQYCIDCPANVKIERIFQLYNDAYMYDKHDDSKTWYKRLMERGFDYSQCIDCEKCEEVCPQQLEIRKHMKDFHQAYAE